MPDCKTCDGKGIIYSKMGDDTYWACPDCLAERHADCALCVSSGTLRHVWHEPVKADHGDCVLCNGSGTIRNGDTLAIDPCPYKQRNTA